MAGTTPIYGLPYPQSSDLVSAYPALGQDLAEDLDGILAAKLGTLSVNAQTGTTYTLTTSDPQKVVTVTNAAASTVTIPTNATAAIPVGSAIQVVNLSTGVNTTIAAAGGVTLNGGSPVLSPGSSVTLVKIGTDAWMIQGQGAPGLLLVASQTFSAASSVSVNNCFQSGNAGYVLILSAVNGSSTEQYLRLRASGTDSSSNYTMRIAYLQSAYGTGTLSSEVRLGDTGTEKSLIVVHLYDVAAAAPTSILATAQDSAATSMSITAGVHTASTAYDGFTFYPGTGTFTGAARVYAYRNA